MPRQNISGLLTERIQEEISDVFQTRPDAWLVWCDPRWDWLPLLQRAAADPTTGGFTLLLVDEWTQGELGGPVSRRLLQERIAAGQPFVLWVPAPANRLGWLWGQALLAERIYDQPLREQLRTWGWRPDRLTITDDELAALARRNLDRDPAQWGGGGLEPDLPLLLDLLATGTLPAPDQYLLLALTIERTGLDELRISEAANQRGSEAANQRGGELAEDLVRWRIRSLARLLVTQAYQAAPGLVSDRHALLIPAGRRALALALLDRWLDSLRLSRTLPAAVLAADRFAGLTPPAVTPNVEHGSFLSHAAESAAFAATCTHLARLSGRDLLEAFATMAAGLARHAAGFWGASNTHPAALPWDELLRLSQAAGAVIDASPTREWANPAEAIAWYTGGGWRLDDAGEEILRNLRRTTPELLALIAPLRAAFRARWEDTLLRWSALWLAAGCPLPTLPTAGEWLRTRLPDSRPTAILMVDALRYDLAASLAARINAAEGAARASLAAARAPLPSITALGMAMALPVPEPELEADIVGGKWLVRHRGRPENLALAAGRRTWWQTHGGVAAEYVMTLADLHAHHPPPPSSGRTRLVVYDSAIDMLGHDDELEAQGSDVVVDRYAALVRRLYEAGWSRILVTTDHGFILWPGSQETSTPAPALDPTYSTRRALAYPAQVTLAGPQALAPGGRWRVALSSGAACFRTYGGLGYFHGGAALQEWIIPCLALEWPVQAQPVMVEVEPLPQVLSQRPRVTLAVRRHSLLVEDAIARPVDVVMRDTQSHAILFRSPIVTATPDRDQLVITLTAIEGTSAPRGTPLRIEVRDGSTEEVLHVIESVLSIEMLVW